MEANGEQADYSGAHILPIPDGLYTGLFRGNEVWTSDYPAEIWWMRGGLDAIADRGCRRVLITGLGLGVIVQHALRQPHVARIDVIEHDLDVYRLVRHHYRAGPRLRVHHGDAYTLALPGAWDVAYHDIWPKRTLGNIPDYIAMGQRWARQVGRQRFWPEEDLAGSVARRGGESADLWARFVDLRRLPGW